MQQGNTKHNTAQHMTNKYIRTKMQHYTTKYNTQHYNTTENEILVGESLRPFLILSVRNTV